MRGLAFGFAFSGWLSCAALEQSGFNLGTRGRIFRSRSRDDRFTNSRRFHRIRFRKQGNTQVKISVAPFDAGDGFADAEILNVLGREGTEAFLQGMGVTVPHAENNPRACIGQHGARHLRVALQLMQFLVGEHESDSILPRPG